MGSASTWGTSRRRTTPSTRSSSRVTSRTMSRRMAWRSCTRVCTRKFGKIPAMAIRRLSPDKSFKRKAKKTLAQRKADVQTKKDAKIAELEEEDDDDDEE